MKLRKNQAEEFSPRLLIKKSVLLYPLSRDEKALDKDIVQVTELEKLLTDS